jgi:DNA ligase D-like protein (predicted 3'-phosphoesterase)
LRRTRHNHLGGQVLYQLLTESIRKGEAIMNESGGRFVVQKHQARTLHYDFRLERDGVLKSWAVPKGLPEETGVRRLAIQVEDHALAYGDFEGTIPAGQYGAGTVEIWDRGTYELHEWGEDRIVFTLHGERYRGPYQLIRFRSKGEREWLIFRQVEANATSSSAS